MIEQVRIVLRIFIANKRFLQRDRRRNAGHAERGEARNKDGPLWPVKMSLRGADNVGKYWLNVAYHFTEFSTNSGRERAFQKLANLGDI